MDINASPEQVLLSRMIQATAQRHRILASNLANADTPGYVRKDVQFDAELRAVADNPAMDFKLTPKEDSLAPAKSDGNNVSLDYEVAQMSENALLHSMATQLLQTKLSMTRMAITGRS